MKKILGVFIILFVLIYSPLIYSQEYIKIEDGFEIIVIKDSSCLYTVTIINNSCGVIEERINIFFNKDMVFDASVFLIPFDVLTFKSGLKSCGNFKKIKVKTFYEKYPD